MSMSEPIKPTEDELRLAKAIVSEMARRAGATKSPARAAASRRNGKKQKRRKAKAEAA